MAIPRVLYIITDSGIGGSEKVLASLLDRLDRNVVAPCGVVVLKKKREMTLRWEQSPVPVFSLGMESLPTPGLLKKLRALVAEMKPDIVHAFLYHSVQLSRLLRLFDRSFKLISSPRVNYRFAPAWALAVDRILKGQDDLVLCESTSTRAFLVNRLGYNKDIAKVILNGVEVEKFKFDPAARDKIRREWGVTDSDLLIGAVGRLHGQKGFPVFLRALNRLKSNGISFKAVIVGDGPEKGRLQNLVGQMGLPVLFAGERQDMADVHSAFDIYCQSSLYEGLSNALLEAMSVGRPIVATAVDGTLDVAQEGSNMLLAHPNDDLDLSEKLRALLGDPELRSSLSERVRQSAERLREEDMIKKHENYYVSLIG